MRSNEELEYLKKIESLDSKVRAILARENCRHDYMDLFHVLNNLCLTPEERLKKGLNRRVIKGSNRFNE